MAILMPCIKPPTIIIIIITLFLLTKVFHEITFSEKEDGRVVNTSICVNISLTIFIDYEALSIECLQYSIQYRSLPTIG